MEMKKSKTLQCIFGCSISWHSTSISVAITTKPFPISTRQSSTPQQLLICISSRPKSISVQEMSKEQQSSMMRLASSTCQIAILMLLHLAISFVMTSWSRLSRPWPFSVKTKGMIKDSMCMICSACGTRQSAVPLTSDRAT